MLDNNNSTAIDSAVTTTTKLLDGLKQVIKGRDDTLRLVITGLLADGHVLLEDYPGSGKTTLTKTLGRLITTDRQDVVPFRRIQFTPDMLPGDVLGVNIFEPATGTFSFQQGPVFAHIVLADELNRTGPKVQAAFLECMAEKQVTIDNTTHQLDELFFVVGTQNPLDLAGTYPLPLVQLDRFLLKIPMSYVDKDAELDILRNHEEIQSSMSSISPACSRKDVLEARKATRSVRVSDAIRETIVDIIQATRNSPVLNFGASTRAALMWQITCQAWAIINERDYVIEDDLKETAHCVLSHRLRFHGGIGDKEAALNEIIEPHLESLIAKGA